MARLGCYACALGLYGYGTHVWTCGETLPYLWENATFDYLGGYYSHLLEMDGEIHYSHGAFQLLLVAFWRFGAIHGPALCIFTIPTSTFAFALALTLAFANAFG